ncbi:MAG: NAD-dependent epimerase/dehydratase family protein [Woeseiaceae bacterium]
MQVLVLGGTGSIGSAIVQVLQERGHSVLALGRSAEARGKLQRAGATAIDGDLREPLSWIDAVEKADGIIHVAAVWGEEMGDVDREVVETLLRTLKFDTSSKPFIYTGGCWLYGQTGNTVATEESPFKPLASFAWSIPTIRIVLSASCVRGMVIHPAMVYERDGGVFEGFIDDAKQLGYVRVIGGEDVRWPLVHRTDLAQLYALMLEKGREGDVYNASAVDGVSIGAIARTIAKRLGVNPDPVAWDLQAAKSAIGHLAAGYALDQQMSGKKAMEQLGWRPKHTDVIADIA